MKKCVLGLVVLVVLHLDVQGQTMPWKPLGPFHINKTIGAVEAPGLGVMRSLDVNVKNPSVILMGGMSSGIWRSADKGITWKNVSANLPIENVKKIQIAASNNKIVYAATTIGIVKSVDNGTSWKFTNLNILDKIPGKESDRWSDDNTLLSVSPSNPNVVLASNSDAVYKSTDGGQSWKPVLSDFKTQFIEFHPVNENIVYIAGAYKKERNTFFIYRSEDKGDHFNEISQGIPDRNKLVRLSDITAAVSPAAPDKLFVLIFGDAMVNTTVKGESKRQMVGAFIESDDAGKSFKSVPQATNYRNIDENYSVFHMYSKDEDKDKYKFDAVDSSFWLASFQQVGWATSFAISPTDPNLMVMAGSNNVYSKNGGKKWDVLRKIGNYGIHGDIQCVKIVGNDVWLANDGGLNYVNLLDRINHRMEGYSGQDLWGFSTSFKGDVMAIGVDHSGTMIYDQKIYGDEWYHLGGGDAMSATLNPLDDQYLYVTPYDHFVIRRPNSLTESPVIKKSPVRFGYIPNRNLEFHPNLVYTVYAIDENSNHWNIKNCSIVKTTDNFATVDTLKKFPDTVYLRRLRVSISDPNYMYVVGGKKRRSAPSNVWMTADGGKTWSDVTPKSKTAIKNGFPDVAISEDNPLKIFLGVGGVQNEEKILISTDGGKTWITDPSKGLPKNEIMTMAIQRGTKEGVYLGCYPGVFYKNSTMSEWMPVGKNLVHTPVNFISVNYNNEKIRIGTYRGVWESDLYEKSEPKALIAMTGNVLKTFGSDSDEEDADQMKIFFYDHSVLNSKKAKWNWEFPGATPSTSSLQNPIINYSACLPGKYSVKLTVTDGKGRTSSAIMKDFIEVKDNYPWILR